MLTIAKVNGIKRYHVKHCFIIAPVHVAVIRYAFHTLLKWDQEKYQIEEKKGKPCTIPLEKMPPPPGLEPGISTQWLECWS